MLLRFLFAMVFVFYLALVMYFIMGVPLLQVVAFYSVATYGVFYLQLLFAIPRPEAEQRQDDEAQIRWLRRYAAEQRQRDEHRAATPAPTSAWRQFLSLLGWRSA